LRKGAPPNGPIDAELTLAQKRVMADTRKIEAEVQYKEMRNAERRGDMISLTAVQREGAELVARIKERLLAAPDEFENRFPSEVRAQCKADFSEFIRQLLLEVSRWTIGGETVDDIILAVARRIEAERARHQAGGR
jgi:phage terminase Nu1 subunit (DNA packaging protein)